jgi:hypothetical protein
MILSDVLKLRQGEGCIEVIFLYLLTIFTFLINKEANSNACRKLKKTHNPDDIIKMKIR